jgi:hypothetical protein
MQNQSKNFYLMDNPLSILKKQELNCYLQRRGFIISDFGFWISDFRFFNPQSQSAIITIK